MNKENYLNIRSQLDFRKKSRHLTFHLLIDLGLFLIMAFSHQLIHGLWSIPIASLILSTLMFRAFSLMHDAVHGAISDSSTINKVVGFYGGTLCATPYNQWKQVHLDHHLWSGNLDKDPSMKIINHFRLTKESGGTMQEIAWKLWFPLLAIRQQWVFWSKSFLIVLTDPKQTKSLVQASLLIAAFVTTLVFLVGAVTTVCGIITYLTLVEVINFPHHLGLPHQEGDHKISPMNQHSVSRTCRYYPWFERHVLLNFNYHVEHHLYPTLPWHELDKAHHFVKQILGEDYNQSRSNAWLRKNRKLKFRDVLENTIYKEKMSPQAPISRRQPDLDAA